MTLTVVTALVMLVGLVGIVVPVLPGLALVWLATGLWAFEHPDRRAWVVFALATTLFAAGVVTRYLVPGRRMREAGIGAPTLFLAVALAVVGFFVVPVVGAPAGFVLGIFLAETARRRDRALAWVATRHALRAVVMSAGIELASGFAIVLVWVGGLLALGTGS